MQACISRRYASLAHPRQAHLCMYVFMYVCMHAYPAAVLVLFIRDKHTYVCVCMFVYMYIYIYTYVCISRHCAHPAHLQQATYVWVCMMYVCMHVYILHNQACPAYPRQQFTETHTHMHTTHTYTYLKKIIHMRKQLTYIAYQSHRTFFLVTRNFTFTYIHTYVHTLIIDMYCIPKSRDIFLVT